MRLAIIGSRGYPSTYGGFETLVRRLAPYLVEQGHSVAVYGRSSAPLLARARVAERDGITCVTTRGIDRRVISTLSYGFTSARHSAAHRPDVAIVLNPANGFFLPFLEKAGVPTIVNVDGLEWQRDKWNALGKAVFLKGARQVATHATRIVVDAEAIGQVWRDKFGVRSTFIPYGADIVEDPKTNLVEALGLAEGQYILYVARMVPENNIDLFLDAVEVLRHRYPVVIVGTAGYGAPIESRLSALAREANVTWMGHVHDQQLLSALWANAGCYFHGHSVGGTNPSLLQAMGAGAPVVAFDSVFNREVLAGAGTMVTGERDAVVAAISAVMASPERRAEQRDLGVARVIERYTWEGVCASYLATAAEAIGTSSPRLERVSQGHGAYPQADLKVP